MPTYKPVNFDPFASAAPSGGVKVRPVDFDPFAKRDPAADRDIEETKKRIARAKALIAGYDKRLADPSKIAGGEMAVGLVSARNAAADSIVTFEKRLKEIERTGKPAPDATVGGVLSDLGRGALRAVTKAPGQITEGVLGLVGSGMQAAGAPFGKDLGLEDLGKEVSRRGTNTKKYYDKLAEDTFGKRSAAAEFDPIAKLGADVGEGIGSTAPYLLTQGLGGVATRLSTAGRAANIAGELSTAQKVARASNYGIAGGQGSQSAGQMAQEFRDQGGTVTPSQEALVRFGGAGLGLTQVGVIDRMLEKLPASARTAAIDSASKFIERATLGRVAPQAMFEGVKKTIADVESRALGRVALSGLDEAAQEGGEQLGQNVLAQTVYNPEQAALEGVAENALLGGIVGGVLKGGIEGTRKVFGSTPDEEAAPTAPSAPRAPRTPTRAPPPAADMGALSKALGPVGGKITLQEPTGPQEYTFQGFDEDGGVVLADADGVVFSEDPDQVQAAIKAGVAEPESGLGGMAFGTDITEGLDDVVAPPAPPPPPPPPPPPTEKPKFTIETVEETAAREAKGAIKSGAVAPPVFSPDVAPPIFSPPAGKPKFTIEEPPPSPKNTQGRSQVGKIIFDQESGVGQVPLNQNVKYRGFTAMMRPSKFLELAADLEKPKQSSLDYIRQSVEEGKGVGSPFLNLDFETGKVKSHDGRHRMMVIQEKNGDVPVPVHIFGKGEQRARSLDEGKISSFASSMTGEDGRQSTDNFSEAFLDEAAVPVSAPAAAAPEPVAPPAPPRAVGKTARVTIPVNRQKFDVQYELQDLDNIKFAEDELQNRDRSRPASDAFVTDTVNNFDPEGLGEDRYTDRGAPIINKDNTILSGNGRTLVLQEIYGFQPDKVEAYHQLLREQGYDIEGIERPVLVRRLMSDADERKFVTASNESDIAALSPPEQAAQDASDILTPGVFAKFKGGDLGAVKNDAFVSAFLAAMSSQGRKNAMDDKGKISAQGLKRIENALLYKAYGGNDRASKIFISKAMERNDDDTKTLTNSLVDVSKDWIQFQQAIEAGEIDKKYDITDKLMETIGTASDIKASGNSVAFELRSPDMVTPMDPFVREILLAFHNDDVSRILSRKAIAEKLKAYTEVAAVQQAEPDMLGMSETPSAREIWKRIDAGEAAPQPDMFARAEESSQTTSKKVRSGIAAAAVLTASPASATINDTPIAPSSALYKSLENGDTKKAIELIQKSSKSPASRRIATILALNGVGEQKTIILDPVNNLDKAINVLSKNGATQEAIDLISMGDVRGMVLSTPKDKNIYLIKNPDPASNGVNEQTFLHEAIHAYVKARWSSVGVYTESNREVLDNRGLYNEEVAAEVKKFNDMWRKFGNVIKKEYEGGAGIPSTVISAAESPNEALAYLLTNKSVQDYAKRVVKDGRGYRLMSENEAGKRSWWDDFVDMIRKIFGLGPSRDQFFNDFLAAGNKILVVGEKAKADFRVAGINEESVSPEKVNNNKQALQAILNGTPSQMRNAVAKAQEPYDKSNEEAADVQSKNRGCD